MKKYTKKAIPVQAIQLNLELEDGILTYIKWGGKQQAKQGDWLVKNGDEVYSVDQLSFANTYQEFSLGSYVKIAPVWAKQVFTNGFIETKEGRSAYSLGSFVVANNEDGTDAYCMTAEKFESMYDPV